MLKDDESAPGNHVLAHNFDKYSPNKKNSLAHSAINHSVIVWLLTIQPHFKYASTLPCNLSLGACFADINVSLDSVAS